MNVIVTYTREADLQIGHRLALLPGTVEDVAMLTVVYMEQIRDYLIKTKGYPPEAILVEETDPPTYRFPFIHGICVEFVIEDQRHWLWRKTRTITIVRFPVVLE